ncbi:hypothetical protein OAX78_01980 [Planctomycetota bacterium]|nr:hypothetical protein [Planctomycetota bacterium]
MSERPKIRVVVAKDAETTKAEDAAAPSIAVDSNAPATHSSAGTGAWLAIGVTLCVVSLAWGWQFTAYGGTELATDFGLDLGPAACLTAGLGCLLHGVLGRPLTRAILAMRQETSRLRAALTCPYCRDTVERSALVCDRDGCGATYHEECWEECRKGYGGCAIYGCGCTTAREVGRFALQRRFWRLLVAAALFPPKAVKRLREIEGDSFRDAWARARDRQRQISSNDTSSVMYGVINGAICIAACLGLFRLEDTGVIGKSAVLALLIPLLLLPVLVIRMPLLATFGWLSSKVLARVFRTELAALDRADAGTVLGRLLAGVGKKG